MKPEIKAKWVAALRSGEYKQGREALRIGDRFCCLGVLCDLHAKDTGEQWKKYYEDEFSYGEDGQTSMLPVEVAKWAGCSPSPQAAGKKLWRHNDGRDAGADRCAPLTFPQIAYLIEANL